MTLSVLIPTIGGREEALAETRAAFEKVADEVLVVYGHSWGEGCNQLARLARGDYLLFACDDAVPHDGWFDAGRALVDERLIPASRYLHPDGAPLHPRDLLPHRAPVEWTRSWLITPPIFEEVGPLIDTTWWADIDYSERMEAAGYPIVGCDGFTFTHLPTTRDWLTPEVEDEQRRVYEQHRRPDLPRSNYANAEP